MAGKNFTLDDDLPIVPKVFTYIHEAETPDEEARAQYMATVCKVAPVTDWVRMNDDELAALCSEPEFLGECSPLERELIVRLVARLEYGRCDD